MLNIYVLAKLNTLEANTSTLNLKYSLTVLKSLPDDEIKYRLATEV